MIEFLRHALGLCGEHSHPSLINALLAGTGIVSGLRYLKWRLKLWNSSSEHQQ